MAETHHTREASRGYGERFSDGRRYQVGFFGLLNWQSFEALDTLENLLRAGYLEDDDPIPAAPRACRGFIGGKVSMLGDGRLRVMLDAEVAAQRDVAFRRFMDAAVRR